MIEEHLSFRSQVFRDMLELTLDDIKEHPEWFPGLMRVYDRLNVCMCCRDSNHLDYTPSVFYDISRTGTYQAKYSIFELMKLIMDYEVEVQLVDDVAFMVSIYHNMRTEQDELIVLKMYNQCLLGNNMFLGLNPSFKGMINAIVAKMKHHFMYFQLEDIDTSEFMNYIDPHTMK